MLVTPVVLSKWGNDDKWHGKCWVRAVGEKDTRFLKEPPPSLESCRIFKWILAALPVQKEMDFPCTKGEEEMRLRVPQRTGKGIRDFTVVAGVEATHPEDHVILRFQF